MITTTCSSEMMDLQITGRHLKVTRSISDYVRTKLKRSILDFPKVIHAHVILEIQKDGHRCEVILQCNDHARFEACKETTDIYSAIDVCMHALKQRMTKYQSRVRQHRHDFGRYALRIQKHRKQRTWMI